jgi:hypothetical protein
MRIGDTRCDDVIDELSYKGNDIDRIAKKQRVKLSFMDHST